LTADNAAPAGDLISESEFAADAEALYNIYVDKFGAPSEGNQIQFRIKAVNPNTGETSVYWNSRIIVVDEA